MIETLFFQIRELSGNYFRVLFCFVMCNSCLFDADRPFNTHDVFTCVCTLQGEELVTRRDAIYSSGLAGVEFGFSQSFYT